MRSPPHPRRQALLRHLLFTAALLTYLLDPVDVVWRAVQHTAHPRAYERLAFTTAALLLAAALALASRRAKKHHSTASLLYTTAIAFLLPWEGALLLTVGELLRSTLTTSLAEPRLGRNRTLIYLSALISMLLFSITLQDRIADIAFGLTFLLALWQDFAPSRPTHSA